MTQPVVHYLLKDGKKTAFTPVPVMTLDEMRLAGAQKIADPNFVESKVSEAIKKAKS
jgi:hypothetical protein